MAQLIMPSGPASNLYFHRPNILRSSVNQTNRDPYRKAFHQPSYNTNPIDCNPYRTPDRSFTTAVGVGAVGQPVVKRPPSSVRQFGNHFGHWDSGHQLARSPFAVQPPLKEYEVICQIVYEIHTDLQVTRNYHDVSGYVVLREPIGVYEYFASDNSYLFVNNEDKVPTACASPSSCRDSSPAHLNCRLVASKRMIRYHSHRSHTPDQTRLVELVFKVDAHAAELNKRLVQLCKQTLSQQPSFVSGSGASSEEMPLAKKPCLSNPMTFWG